MGRKMNDFESGIARQLDQAWDEHRGKVGIDSRRQSALKYASFMESAHMNGMEVVFRDGKHEVKEGGKYEDAGFHKE